MSASTDGISPTIATDDVDIKPAPNGRTLSRLERVTRPRNAHDLDSEPTDLAGLLTSDLLMLSKRNPDSAMSFQSDLPVLIIGAGISGLTAALALSQSKYKNITIYEKSDSLTNEIGQGITLSPNGGRILRSLGVNFEKWKIVDFFGANISSADELKHLKETVNQEVEVEGWGMRMKCAYRPDLLAALLERVKEEGLMIETGKKVVRWGDGEVEFEGGEVRKGELIVAADGVRSQAPEYVMGGSGVCPTLDSSGTIVYRFTLPTEKILNDPEIAFLLDAGHGMCSFNVSPDRKKWLVRYYCRADEICNFALYVLREQESEGERRLRYSADRGSLEAEMEGFHPALLKLVRLANDVLPLWRCTTREPLTRLHRGKTVVIGDAAHPMLPHVGLGAVSAIEDAGALGALLEGVEDDGDNADLVEERLRLFSQMRVPRVAVYKYYSDVPFFRDMVAEQKEEVEKWVRPEELPCKYLNDLLMI